MGETANRSEYWLFCSFTYSPLYIHRLQKLHYATNNHHKNSTSMSTFEFATATRIIFGAGTLTQLGPLAAAFGSTALLVTGRTPQRGEKVAQQIGSHDIRSHNFVVTSEPTIDVVDAGANQARQLGCDVVISIGGGSAIDAGKAVAALATNPGRPLDYLEVIGAGKPLVADPLPFIAIPTTAGTGAEVTKNAVLASTAHAVKVSLRDNRMLPNIALIDPELTYDMPPAITATTGMDALTQVLEPYVSHLATPITDGFCREGLRRAARSLCTVFHNGDDAAAREDMALCSLFGGLALANAKLGAVHGIAGPLGGMFPAPHGAVCGKLLPAATAINIAALHSREPENPALARYTKVARILTGDPNAQAKDAVTWLDALGEELALPGLGTYGIGKSDFANLIAKSSRSSSMKGNPIVLMDEEILEIVRRSL